MTLYNFIDHIVCYCVYFHCASMSQYIVMYVYHALLLYCDMHPMIAAWHCSTTHLSCLYAAEQQVNNGERITLEWACVADMSRKAEMWNGMSH